MDPIVYIDRLTQQMSPEKVYGESFIKAIYGDNCCSKLLRKIVTHSSFISKIYGFLQKSSFSRKKIEPFIKKFEVDSSEFADPISSYKSFNDFFIRKLAVKARPIVEGKQIAILPADGRYLVYPNLLEVDGFLVKGKKFSLNSFLQDNNLAEMYKDGAMVIARLCPTDYHRYHFPIDCTALYPKKIKGNYDSVNPIALKKKIEIFSENKREITLLKSDFFGEVAFVEVGAVCVGSIHHTFTPMTHVDKGSEKGYFSFGGSTIVLLFEKDRIVFDADLVNASEKKIEVKGLMGQSLGRAGKLDTL